MIIHNINAIYKTEYKVLNVSNLNTFTNSSNISTIPSSILYNRTHRSANGKIMNVLLLLFLVFGSCVVSFGMNTKHLDDENEENEKQQYDNKVQESILHAQFIATIQTISKQNDGNAPKQEDNTFDQGANHVIIIYPIDRKDITRIIRFLICMDLIDRDRFINDNTIKSSGYYYPWYLKHHIFTQSFYRGL